MIYMESPTLDMVENIKKIYKENIPISQLNKERDGTQRLPENEHYKSLIKGKKGGIKISSEIFYYPVEVLAFFPEKVINLLPNNQRNETWKYIKGYKEYIKREVIPLIPYILKKKAIFPIFEEEKDTRCDRKLSKCKEDLDKCLYDPMPMNSPNSKSPNSKSPNSKSPKTKSPKTKSKKRASGLKKSTKKKAPKSTKRKKHQKKGTKKNKKTN